MTTEIATLASSGTLAITGDQMEWSPVQHAALAHIGIAEAPLADQQVFLHVCQRVGLDPFSKQIYMIKRSERGKDKWTIQTGIDGFRLVAEDHAQYAGTLDPEWCGADGKWRPVWTEQKPPVAARVVVLRHDRQHPISLPVRFSEFAATFADGNLQGQWKTKPAHMIAKCAEAAALRKAFPRQLSGVFTDDEMDHVERAARAGRAGGGDRSTALLTSAELTGQAPPAAAEEVLADEPVVDEVVDGEVVDEPQQPVADEDAERKPSTQQMNKLFACIRDAGIEDRNTWASGLLSREITSYGQLSAGDASHLIDTLERGLAALEGDDQADELAAEQ